MKLLIGVALGAAVLTGCKDKKAAQPAEKVELQERDDPAETMRLMKEACAAKEPGACADVAMAGIVRDRPGTLTKLTSMCDAGDGAACNALASEWDNHPDGHTSDEIIGLWDKGCTLEDANSCNILGNVFLWGRNGRQKDMAKARAAIQRGCDLGDQPMCEQVKTIPAN